MRRIFSIIYWVFFAVSLPVMFLVALLVWAVTTPFDRSGRALHYWSCVWAWFYVLIFPGWRAEALHRERIDPRQPYVIVANHTSVADIVLCFGLFRPFKWVSKKSLFSLPFLGWNMRLRRDVPLVRGNAASIEKMLKAAGRWLDRGVSVMMFPEGTRSADGRVKAFKHGAFTLAREHGVPVVPVAIHGGADLIPKHGRMFATRADLRVEVLEPIPPHAYPDVASYAEAVRQAIVDRLATPRDGAQPEAAPEGAAAPFSTAAAAAVRKAVEPASPAV